MDDYRLPYVRPITTGMPPLAVQKPSTQSKEGQSFRSALDEAMAVPKTSVPRFSKHAAQRIATRSIDLSNGRMERLNEGIRLAQEKNIEDALIMVDNAAFVVNAKSQTVITAVGSTDMKGKAFTNIQGAVIV